MAQARSCSAASAVLVAALLLCYNHGVSAGRELLAPAATKVSAVAQKPGQLNQEDRIKNAYKTCLNSGSFEVLDRVVYTTNVNGALAPLAKPALCFAVGPRPAGDCQGSCCNKDLYPASVLEVQFGSTSLFGYVDGAYIDGAPAPWFTVASGSQGRVFVRNLQAASGPRTTVSDGTVSVGVQGSITVYLRNVCLTFSYSPSSDALASACATNVDAASACGVRVYDPSLQCCPLLSAPAPCQPGSVGYTNCFADISGNSCNYVGNGAYTCTCGASFYTSSTISDGLPACVAGGCFAGEARVWVKSGASAVRKMVKDVQVGEEVQCISSSDDIKPGAMEWCPVANWGHNIPTPVLATYVEYARAPSNGGGSGRLGMMDSHFVWLVTAGASFGERLASLAGLTGELTEAKNVVATGGQLMAIAVDNNADGVYDEGFEVVQVTAVKVERSDAGFHSWNSKDSYLVVEDVVVSNLVMGNQGVGYRIFPAPANTPAQARAKYHQLRQAFLAPYWSQVTHFEPLGTTGSDPAAQKGTHRPWAVQISNYIASAVESGSTFDFSAFLAWYQQRYATWQQIPAWISFDEVWAGVKGALNPVPAS